MKQGIIHLLRLFFDYENNSMSLTHAKAIMNLYKTDLADGIRFDSEDKKTVLAAHEIVRGAGE